MNIEVVYDVQTPLWDKYYMQDNIDWIAHVFRSVPAMSERDFMKLVMKKAAGKVNPQWVRDVYKEESKMRELIRQLNKEVFKK